MALFSPKRKQNRNKSETIVDKAVGLVKKPSGPTPGQIATQNRDIGAEIISVLRSIDFAHGRLRDLVDEEEYRTMIRTRDVAMKMLQESPTIFDEVAQIGSDMCYAAKAWKEAVKDGLPSKARYAKQAVASGASTFWSNIPEDKEEERAAILKKREEYFSNFKKAIQTCDSIDYIEKNIAKTNIDIKNVMGEIATFAAQVQEMTKTAEGRDRFAKIYDSLTDFSQLSVDDMNFGLQLRENIARERKLDQLRGAYYTDKQQLTSKKQDLDQLGLALRDNPNQTNRDLTAEIVALAKRMADEMAHKISEITVAEREREANRDRLKSILNGEAAMELRGREAKELDKLVVGQETSPEATAVHSTSLGQVDRLIQKRDARQLEEARQAAAVRQAVEDHQAALEAAQQVLENAETAQAENENVAAESADNFNIKY